MTRLRLLALGSLTWCGCEAISNLATDGRPAQSVAALHKLSDQHRLRFQSDGDPAAFEWLLENRIAAGMSVQSVSTMLGQEGERVINDRWIKDRGGWYRESDTVVRWGPDSNARSVYLVFRDQRLMLPRSGFVWE
ncbi:MAG: hypothetical protein ABGZ17_15585 [Planctomycetaceae bacterium]